MMVPVILGLLGLVLFAYAVTEIRASRRERLVESKAAEWEQAISHPSVMHHMCGWDVTDELAYRDEVKQWREQQP